MNLIILFKACNLEPKSNKILGQKCIRIITIQSNGDKKRFGHRKIIYEVNGQIGHGKCVTTAKLFTI